MSNPLSARLSEIQVANKAELRTLWRQSFPESSLPNLNRNLMAAVLAHRAQEEAFGPLSSDLTARLRRLARTIEVNPDASVPLSSTMKPGTRLVRRWKGRNHLVTVEPNGFEYCGTRYDSLSQIARLITGTRWSGPLFFGLRTKPELQVQHGE